MAIFNLMSGMISFRRPQLQNGLSSSGRLHPSSRCKTHRCSVQLEAGLAHMNRLSMMGELPASLAHEIKQPIATARNNASAPLNFLAKHRPDMEFKHTLVFFLT